MAGIDFNALTKRNAPDYERFFRGGLTSSGTALPGYCRTPCGGLRSRLPVIKILSDFRRFRIVKDGNYDSFPLILHNGLK